MTEPSLLELTAAVEAARRAGWQQDEITLAGWITARIGGRARPETPMPETPDFESIARTVAQPYADAVEYVGDDETPVRVAPNEDDLTASIVEALRICWNARGAADLAKIEAELSMMIGSTASGPYVKNLDRALRTLDR